MCCLLHTCISLFLPVAIFGFGYNPVPYTTCSKSRVLEVSMTPCAMIPRPHPYGEDVACFAYHGDKLTMNVRFISPFESEEMVTNITVKFDVYKINAPESKKDACQILLRRCPVGSREKKRMRYEFDVLKYYPPGRMTIEVGIVDKRNKQHLVCVSFVVVVLTS